MRTTLVTYSDQLILRQEPNQYDGNSASSSASIGDALPHDAFLSHGGEAVLPGTRWAAPVVVEGRTAAAAGGCFTKSIPSPTRALPEKLKSQITAGELELSQQQEQQQQQQHTTAPRFGSHHSDNSQQHSQQPDYSEKLSDGHRRDDSSGGPTQAASSVSNYRQVNESTPVGSPQATSPVMIGISKQPPSSELRQQPAAAAAAVVTKQSEVHGGFQSTKYVHRGLYLPTIQNEPSQTKETSPIQARQLSARRRSILAASNTSWASPSELSPPAAPYPPQLSAAEVRVRAQAAGIQQAEKKQLQKIAVQREILEASKRKGGGAIPLGANTTTDAVKVRGRFGVSVRTQVCAPFAFSSARRSPEDPSSLTAVVSPKSVMTRPRPKGTPESKGGAAPATHRFSAGNRPATVGNLPIVMPVTATPLTANERLRSSMVEASPTFHSRVERKKMSPTTSTPPFAAARKGGAAMRSTSKAAAGTPSARVTQHAPRPNSQFTSGVKLQGSVALMALRDASIDQSPAKLRSLDIKYSFDERASCPRPKESACDVFIAGDVFDSPRSSKGNPQLSSRYGEALSSLQQGSSKPATPLVSNRTIDTPRTSNQQQPVQHSQEDLLDLDDDPPVDNSDCSAVGVEHQSSHPAPLPKLICTIEDVPRPTSSCVRSPAELKASPPTPTSNTATTVPIRQSGSLTRVRDQSVTSWARIRPSDSCETPDVATAPCFNSGRLNRTGSSSCTAQVAACSGSGCSRGAGPVITTARRPAHQLAKQRTSVCSASTPSSKSAVAVPNGFQPRFNQGKEKPRSMSGVRMAEATSTTPQHAHFRQGALTSTTASSKDFSGGGFALIHSSTSVTPTSRLPILIMKGPSLRNNQVSSGGRFSRGGGSSSSQGRSPTRSSVATTDELAAATTSFRSPLNRSMNPLGIRSPTSK